MNHYVWPDDENETLCGKDVNQAEWQEKVDCPKCLEVNDFLATLERFTEFFLNDTKAALEHTFALWRLTHE